jgi:hypothetical protein
MLLGVGRPPRERAAHLLGHRLGGAGGRAEEAAGGARAPWRRRAAATWRRAGALGSFSRENSTAFKET